MRILLLSESIIIIIVLLLSLALMTLAERKVMGVIQRRVGPNKVGYGGILQPISDGLKVRDGMLDEKREEEKGRKIAASLDRRGYQILKKACLRLEFQGLEKEISKMKTLKTRKEKVKGLQFCLQGYEKIQREGPHDNGDGSDRPKGMKESYKQNIGLSSKGDLRDKGGIMVPNRGGSILGNFEPPGGDVKKGKRRGKSGDRDITRKGGRATRREGPHAGGHGLASLHSQPGEWTGRSQELRGREALAPDQARDTRYRLESAWEPRPSRSQKRSGRKGERLIILGYEIGWLKEGRIGVKAPIGRIMERVREGGMVRKGKAYPNFRWYTKGREEIVRKYKEIIEGYLGYYKEVENYKELETILRRVL